MRRIFPFALLAALIAQASEAGSTAGSLRSALQSKALAWSLSEPGEVEAILGAPRARSSQRDGGMELEVWSYGPEVDVFFRRERGSQAPFVLAGLREGERVTRPLPGERLVLRSASDLGKLPPFTGLRDVDARNADLRMEGGRLAQWTFSTRTLWPPREKLPAGFDPETLVEAGTNPGLGLRKLHREGVDGRGVAVGIVDQPLLTDHEEIAERLRVVAELDVKGVPPQKMGSGLDFLL